MSTRSAIASVKDAVAHVDTDQVVDHAHGMMDQVQDGIRRGLDYGRHELEHGLQRAKEYLPDANISTDEQKLSVLGGAAIAALGLTRITRPSGWLALGLGAALIVRGTTGVCGLYKAMGINTKK